MGSHNPESMGELQVTIVAGRNLRSDGKSEVAYCTVDLAGNKTARTNTNKSREPIWNESFNFDLLSLDNDEVLIQVFGKRRITADKFLGQIQVPIKGLTLSKDLKWHFLSDKPKNLHELPEHMRVDTPQTGRKNRSPSISKIKEPRKSPHKDDKKKAKEEKDEKTFISGEISIRLNFTHRFLLRGKSRRDLNGATNDESDASPPDTPTAHTLPLPPSFSSLGSDSNGIKMEATLGSPRVIDDHKRPPIIVPKLSLTPRMDQNTALSSPLRKDEKQVSFPGDGTPRSMVGAPNTDEAKLIETAFREKLQLVKQKLKEKRELVSLLTSNVNLLKNQEDQEKHKTELNKLNEMQRELTELEHLEKEFMESLDNSANKPNSISHSPSMRNIDRSKSRAQLKERRNTRVMDGQIFPRERRNTRGGMDGIELSRRTSKRIEFVPQFELNADNFVDETKYLRHRVSILETELNHERKMSDLVNSKNTLLEKETKRLEEEMQKQQFAQEMREKELLQARSECERLAREVRRLNGGKDSVGDEEVTMGSPFLSLNSTAGIFFDSACREGAESAFDTVRKICSQVKSISKESKDDIDSQRREIEESLRGVELSIERHLMIQKRAEVDTMSRRLVKRQELLASLDGKHNKRTANSEGDYSEDYDDESDDDDVKTLTPRSHGNDAKLDMLVVKLEKLDKLDELLKKIDNMKYASGSYGGDIGNADQGRNYEDIKKELEEYQKVIVDDSGKYTEKEKDEANIKYEKAFTELSQTKQYKAEVAQQMEEKRKANEPLNKAALEKMIKVLSAENLRNDPTLRDKVLKNPELSLIGLEPKAILAKHQNDFSQYLLRLTEIDELRAIRASLPKFRSDQKRQLDWVEVLESKIDTVSKAPAKKPPPPKAPTAKSWKPKPPAASAKGGTDMFAELLAKRKKVQVDDSEQEEANTTNRPTSPPRSPSSLNSSSSSVGDNGETDSSGSGGGKVENAGGSVRGRLKLAPSKAAFNSSAGNSPSLGRSSGVAPPPPPPPPIQF